MPGLSRTGAVDLTWGDGDHTYRLAIGQLRELEEKTKLGPVELFQKMVKGAWRVDEVRHVLRIGLKGGGMPEPDAVAFVDRHIDEWPWFDTVAVALHVLTVAISGYPEDDPTAGKAEAGARNGSASPASTQTAPS
jgi:hypothetical protein